MLGLFEKCEVKAGSAGIFYNHFTSLSSPDELTELGICWLGVFQENRFQYTLFTNKAKLAKKRSGSYDFAIDGKNLVVSWLDSKVVTCSTNYVTCNPVSMVQQWSKSTKKKIDMAMLKALQVFDKCVGSVDLFDQIVATYRVRITSKKMLQTLQSWIKNTTYLLKEHRSIVVVSIVVVDVFTYTKKEIFLSILTVSKFNIHRNKTWCCLLDKGNQLNNFFMTDTDI